MEPQPSITGVRMQPATDSLAASTLPWQIVGAVVLSVSFLVLLVIAFSVMSRYQIVARDRLEGTIAADHALDRVQALMVDAETAVRGYVLIGGESMLEPYYNAKKKYLDALSDVATLTADDGPQQESVDVLRGLVDDKWAILDTSVDRQGKLGVVQLPAATESTRDTPGKLVMDAIRNQVLKMHVRESLIREQLAQVFRRAVFYTRASVLFSSFLAL